MACNDDRGREVLEACRAAGLHVPEELAVVGVDNDQLLCELADPPLSSVMLNAEAGGYRSAALLDRLMRRRLRKPRRLVIEPLHVVTRRSTDIVATEDTEVAAALNFIHHHASQPCTVDDVVRQLQICADRWRFVFDRPSDGRCTKNCSESAWNGPSDCWWRPIFRYPKLPSLRATARPVT